MNYVDRSGASRAVNTLLGQAQPQSKRPRSRKVRSAGREPCLCVPSASPPFLKGVANRLSATDALPGNSRQILLYGLCRNLSIYWVLFYGFPVFRGVLGWVFPGTAPSVFGFFGRTAQYRSSPSLACVFPHPLQNRVPRSECVPVARKLRTDRSGSVDRVLLPLPQNRRKHCVSAGFLFIAFRLNKTPGSTRGQPV